MDSTLTSGEVARALGVSIPRVLRAAAAGIVPAERGPAGRLRFPLDVVDALRRRWGSCPKIGRLDREEALVLAALARRPLGLRSARAAARAAGVSPTTASRALQSLRSRGYVVLRDVRAAEGRARGVRIWTVRWSARRWLRIAGEVGRCVLPDPGDAPTVTRVPRRLAHLFWNADVNDLDHIRDGHYIADRILRDGDAQGLAWLAKMLPKEAIAAAACGRGLERRRAALGRVLAG